MTKQAQPETFEEWVRKQGWEYEEDWVGRSAARAAWQARQPEVDRLARAEALLRAWASWQQGKRIRMPLRETTRFLGGGG